MDKLQLVIGNKNLSSWSLRPWLLLAESGLPFEETLVPFGTKGWAAKTGSPSGRVPVLRHGDVEIWESLAIREYIAELAPERQLWPADRAARAEARAVSCEMHAGFPDLRNECSMNIIARVDKVLSPAAARDLARVDELWTRCRARYASAGPFLFGRFSIADAMFAPVVLRVESFRLPLSPAARVYADLMLELKSLQRWVAGAAAELEAGIDDPNPHGAMFSRAEALIFAQAWAAAWSRRDVEAVLAFFEEDAVFSNLPPAALTGVAEVRGKAALRAHWSAALARLSSLEVEPQAAAWDGESNTLAIRSRSLADGKEQRLCELLRFSRARLVVQGEAFYG